MAKLVVISGDTGWQECPVEGSVLIGRGDGCDARIEQPRVSRQHARISRVEGGYTIEDLQTSNGTMVNGHTVTKSALRDGDRIMLGACELMFVLEEGAAPQDDGVWMDAAGSTVISTVDVRMPAAGPSDLVGAAKVEQLKNHLNVLQEVADTACGELQIDNLLELIIDQLLQVFPQAEYAHALLLGQGEAGRDLHLTAARDRRQRTNVGISRTLLDIATSERRAVLAKDAESDARLGNAASIVGLNLRSMMCSPLVVGEKVLGAIQVNTTSADRPFTTDDLQLLATVSGQVAVAAENARLHRDLVAQQRLAAVGETISSLAHCIKNVLNGLKGGAYILDIGIQKTDAEKTTKGWQMVKRNTDFMFDLVKDMLTYCKKEVPEREATDVGDLLNDTLLMVRESASQKGVETSLTLSDEMPKVKIDATAMKRAILNLITNAVEACPVGSHVRVTAEADGSVQQLLIAVEDDGPGIPADLTERLFEPFFTTKGSHGTGLGLPFVKKVVEEHGGRVEVQSEPGHGATFRIWIPVIAAEPDASGSE